LPLVLRRALVALQAEYSAFRPHELATICYARFGRRPGLHTIKRVLAEEPAPGPVTRRYQTYAQMADPLERRFAIMRLHAEGWTITSIAGYLGTNRTRVYKTLRRWAERSASGRACGSERSARKPVGCSDSEHSLADARGLTGPQPEAGGIPLMKTC
jgi:Homeodomain-like domain